MANSNINLVSIPTANISSNNVAFLSVLYSSNTGRMIYLNNVFTYFVSTLSNTNINLNNVNTLSANNINIQNTKFTANIEI